MTNAFEKSLVRCETTAGTVTMKLSRVGLYWEEVEVYHFSIAYVLISSQTDRNGHHLVTTVQWNCSSDISTTGVTSFAWSPDFWFNSESAIHQTWSSSVLQTNQYRTTHRATFRFIRESFRTQVSLSHPLPMNSFFRGEWFETSKI